MGKRSRNRMTGLSPDGRVKRSVKRKAEEEKHRIEERVKIAEAMFKPSAIVQKHRKTLYWGNKKPSG